MPVEFLHSVSELEHKIVTMHLEGWSIRSLHRHFHLGRNRVRRILRTHCRRRAEAGPPLVPLKTAPRPSKLDTYLEQMRGLLDKFPGISAVRVREELILSGYTGGITILRERLRHLRPKPKREPIVRFETEPGVQGQMDWSPYTIDFSKGGEHIVLCFSYILGYSRRQYIDFVTNRDFYTLIRRHVDAFGYFQGVPWECLYDNEKTVVLRWEAGRPVFNPAFIDFITHYQCKPVACRQGRPETKGKVERPFQYVEGNLLNGRTFQDLDDLRTCCQWWLAQRSDTHIHETTGRAPLEMFLCEEKSRLISLPAHPFDCGQVALRICSLDGFLEFEANHYSVPYEYVGDILALKATEHHVRIYSPYVELIAEHQRQSAGCALTCEEPAHRKSKSIRYGLEPVRESFERLGDSAKAFLQGLQHKHPRHCGFHARRILLLKERYHAEDIDKACEWASRYQAYDETAIQRILSSRAIPRTLESVRNQKARAELQKTLPPIRQRNLAEYSLLLGKDTTDADNRSDPEQHPRTSRDPADGAHGDGTGQAACPGGEG